MKPRKEASERTERNRFPAPAFQARIWLVTHREGKGSHQSGMVAQGRYGQGVLTPHELLTPPIEASTMSKYFREWAGPPYYPIGDQPNGQAEVQAGSVLGLRQLSIMQGNNQCMKRRTGLGKSCGEYLQEAVVNEFIDEGETIRADSMGR